MAKDAPATTDQMTVTQFMNSCQTMAWTDGPFNRSLLPRLEGGEQIRTRDGPPGMGPIASPARSRTKVQWSSRFVSGKIKAIF